VKLKIGIVLAVAAFAAVAAGSARATSQLQFGAADDSTSGTITMICADGTQWVFPDDSYFDAETFGAVFCDGNYTIVQPVDSTTNGSNDNGGGSEAATSSGGTDVGFGADQNMAPDPSQYTTEVQCPDGSIWAVASGDDFVCPAA